MWLITAVGTARYNRGFTTCFRMRGRCKEHAIGKFENWWGKAYRLVTIRQLRSSEI